MKVQLCYTLADTPEGKVRATEIMTVKEATEYYEQIKSDCLTAYLRHFDGWHQRTYKTLKEVEK